MSKTLTTEEFIEKAQLVHGKDKYRYDEVNYINAKTDVKIFCNKCLEYFYQNASVHICNHGCKKCAINYRASIKKLKKEDFVLRANKVHKNKYTYELVDFKTTRDKVKIFCKEHNEYFEQILDSHLYQGAGCRKCANEMLSIRHTSTTEEFTNKSKILHNNFYSYDNVEYLGTFKKVIVTCPLHDNFEITPHMHLQGQGCKACAHLKTSRMKSENPLGWSYSSWKRAAERSKYFDSFKIYFIECWNNEERFLKVGRTFVAIKSRLSDLKYNYIILNTFSSNDSQEICKNELNIKMTFKKQKYLPLIDFGGKHECFNISAKDAILKYINNYETRN